MTATWLQLIPYGVRPPAQIMVEDCEDKVKHGGDTKVAQVELDRWAYFRDIVGTDGRVCGFMQL